MLVRHIRDYKEKLEDIVFLALKTTHLVGNNICEKNIARAGNVLDCEDKRKP